MILVRTQVDFDLGQCADYGLVLGLIDALERPQHGQDIVVLLVLLDRLHARIVVLLVAEEHVVEERALAWKESTGDFEGLRMPEFAFQLSVFLYFWLKVLGP